MRKAEILQRQMLGARDQRRDGLGQRLSAAIHVDEDEAAPAFAFERHQRVVARIEILRRPEIARRCEPSVERVTPAMVTADKRALALAGAVIGQGSRAVAADIVEGADLPVRPAHRHQRIARGRGGNIAARFGQLAFMGEHQP